MGEHILEIKDLHVSFDTYAGEVKAVDGVTFTLHEGETLGLVGESGCGKTTTGKALLNLYPRYTTGEVIYEGKNILKMPDPELRPIRRNMQMIFQDPSRTPTPPWTLA